MIPGQKDVWFLPLGGTGEIGMNLNLYGHAGAWLMVDCGVTFEKVEGRSLNRVEMADPSFIANRSESLIGLIATHAHEDHIGAIAHLWDQFRCPIYTTPFTRNVILRKLREKSIDAPIITVPELQPIELGPFRVTWLPITHSTPETNALLIETSQGDVLHTADWKLDSAPIVGAAVAPARYEALGSRNLLATVCDSTNATVSGHSVSESELFEDLLSSVKESTGRVVMGCFSSNIARLQTLGHVARLSGRYIGLAGRSLQNMVRSAKMAGYLAEDFDVVDSFNMGYLLPEETLVIATGSQGESRAALSRLAGDSHPDFNLAAGDHVIFSSKTIPGNEEEVARLLNALESRGIRVTHADNSSKRLHASGHPCAEELQLMYQWTRPRIAVPVHGEERHMQANAAIAKASGVPRSMVGRNGSLYDLVEGRFIKAEIPVGRLWLEDENGRGTLRRVKPQ